MKRCVKCGLPETYETIEFDTEGVMQYLPSATI